jgi:hypothetical protein
MTDRRAQVHDVARVILAGIRVVNGAAGLFAPRFLLRNLGVDPDANPAALYAFRMFGVRTVIIGVQLLLPEGPLRRQALSTAPIIHASDVAAATLAGLPARGARTAAGISVVNTILAVLAQPRQPEAPNGE